MDDLDLSSFELIDIKKEGISEKDLDAAAEYVGSYESLFSKRAMKYRQLGLHEMDLTEADFKNYILQEYTFLKRPMFIIDNRFFVGSSKKVVTEVQNLLGDE